MDDLDFMELYDWVLSMGGGKTTYIDEFLEFTGAFVDSKLRRLRFAAFGIVNKAGPQFPRGKLASLYRASRKN